MAKYKILIFLTEVRSDAEGRERLRRALLPLPLPYGIQVCVTDQMKLFRHDFLLGIVRFFSYILSLWGNIVKFFAFVFIISHVLP